MEYGVAGAAAAKPECVRKESALDRIADHANTAGRVCSLLQNFLDRFAGRDGDSETKGTLSEVPVGHAAQLDRLAKNLELAEGLARDLQSIG